MDELANTIEAGLRAGEAASAGENFEMGHAQLIDPAITDALAALADYRKRVAALEAFVERVNDIAPKEHMDWFTSDEEILFELGKQARALLAGSDGGAVAYPPPGATLLAKVDVTVDSGQSFTVSTTLPADVMGLDGKSGTGYESEGGDGQR